MAASVETVSSAPGQLPGLENEAWQSARQYMDSRLHGEPTSTTRAFEIPIIDLTKSFTESLADREKIARQIRAACMGSGFFYIKNHGIPSSSSSSILKQARRLFTDLPFEKKERIHVRNSPYYHGWEPAEATTINGDAESKECFNWGYEEELDESEGDGNYVQIDGSKKKGNLWPEEEDLPNFHADVKRYYGQVLQLARHLSRLFALSLELPETYFDSMITHPGGVARLVRYPASKDTRKLGEGREGEDIGLGAHSDYQCCKLASTSSLEYVLTVVQSHFFYAPRHQALKFSRQMVAGSAHLQLKTV